MIFIFKNFSKKNSIFLILLCLTFQIADIAKGIDKNSFRKKPTIDKNYDQIWKFIEKNYSKIRTTYHINN